jgi:hypothetical protein
MGTTDQAATTSTPGAVRDQRTPPRGVLPRRVQTWIMAGLALVIIVVILVTGHQAPPAPATADRQSASQPVPAPAERIRSFQREITEREAREVRALPVATPQADDRRAVPNTVPPQGPAIDDGRRRASQSLFG